MLHQRQYVGGSLDHVYVLTQAVDCCKAGIPAAGSAGWRMLTLLQSEDPTCLKHSAQTCKPLEFQKC